MKPIIYPVIAVMVILASCMNNGSTLEEKIIGKWVEPVPGNEREFQGIEFLHKNVAQSINMATLQYSSWKLRDSILFLSGKSIGNGVTIDFEDTLTIMSLSDTALVLEYNRSALWKFRRMSE